MVLLLFVVVLIRQVVVPMSSSDYLQSLLVIHTSSSWYLYLEKNLTGRGDAFQFSLRRTRTPRGELNPSITMQWRCHAIVVRTTSARTRRQPASKALIICVVIGQWWWYDYDGTEVQHAAPVTTTAAAVVYDSNYNSSYRVLCRQSKDRWLRVAYIYQVLHRPPYIILDTCVSYLYYLGLDIFREDTRLGQACLNTPEGPVLWRRHNNTIALNMRINGCRASPLCHYVCHVPRAKQLSEGS